MKTCIQKKSERGAILVGILVVGVIISTVLVALVALVTQEHKMLTKSATWNSALPIAESGIEEAMSHMRQVGVGPRFVNGWTVTSVTNIYLYRTNSEGIYRVLISGATPPIVTSTGLVWSARDSKYVERRIRANTKGISYFMRAISAKQTINLSGNASIDSFDSANPLYSTNGVYDATKKKDNGDVATNADTPGAINMGGQAKIYGGVATGPTGTITMSNPAQVKVGSIAHIDGGGSGIEAGKYSKDMNVAFPNVDPPFTWGYNSAGFPSPLIPLTVSGTNFLATFVNGDYSLNTINIPANKYWLISGITQIYVKQDVLVEGCIVIMPGASLQMYVEKGTVTFKGNGVRNASGYAGNFALWCMPQVTSVNFSGEASYVGTVYAPNSTLNMTGQGSNGLDLQGAAVANAVTTAGGFSFHYDEQLQNTGLRNLQVVSWREI